MKKAIKKTVSLVLALCIGVFALATICTVVNVVNSSTPVYAATEDDTQYDLDWSQEDLTEYTDRVQNEAVEAEGSSGAILAPAVAAACAGAACIGLGVAFGVVTARRKRK